MLTFPDRGRQPDQVPALGVGADDEAVRRPGAEAPSERGQDQ